jgi:hypothetical protein
MFAPKVSISAGHGLIDLLFMYGVLHSDGTLEDLPSVTAACLVGEYLHCYDSQDQEVAHFPTSSVFGRTDTLKRIQPYLIVHSAQANRV